MRKIFFKFVCFSESPNFTFMISKHLATNNQVKPTSCNFVFLKKSKLDLRIDKHAQQENYQYFASSRDTEIFPFIEF